MIKCDFCDREREGLWRYPARDIRFVLGQSTGDWAACEDCYEFIERNDRRGLIEHAVRIMARKPETRAVFGKDTEEVVRLSLEHVHGKFFEARLPGDPTPTSLDNPAEGVKRSIKRG